MTESVEVQMTKLLDESSQEVQDAANKAIKRVARETVKRLKNTSPKRSGEYARDWAVKNLSVHGNIVNLVVHNRKHYQLTHLLENGHVIRNKKGTYGRAPAHPHIGPAEEWASIELPAQIERELK